MFLRRTRCPSDTVSTRTTSEHDDDVTGFRTLATHLVFGNGTHHSTNLQTFRLVIGVIDFANVRRGQTNLVAVGGIAGSSGLGNHRLRELARQRGGNRSVDVTRARNTQCLIHIATTAQRVADGAAHAGGCPAERLNLRRVVVRLVLVHQQPVLLLAIDIHLHADAAGVVLLGDLLVGEVAALVLVFAVNGGQIH